MRLYTLLKDRASINVLKILHDNESVSKKYTMKHTELVSRLSVPELPATIPNLGAAELISSEKSDSGELVISITQKGKDFVTQFDKLIELMAGKKQELKAYQVEYELNPLEQRILILCSKMKSESGLAVPLKALTQEVYPYKDPSSKSGSVSKHAKKLEGLNLLKRVKNNNRTFFDVTEIGDRVIKDQFMNISMPNI